MMRHLREAYPQLSPQLRRAARYMLDRPDEMALSSMRQLAGQAGVQPATMVRLAKQLGCGGYAELRESFRDRLLARRDAYGARARRLQARNDLRPAADAARDGLASLAEEMFRADSDNLATTLARCDPARLAAAARSLDGARRLYVVGSRSLFPAAFTLHYGCRLFRDGTILLDGRGGTFHDALRGLDRDDAMVAFSVAPYSRDAVAAAAFAAERGAPVVAVTDSPVAPLARLAAHALLVANDSPALFDSVVSAMAVAQVLVAQLLAQGGPAALAAVGESEAQLARFDAYWPDTELVKAANGKALP